VIRLKPGDVIITNNPPPRTYHLNDVVMSRAIFDHGGRIAAFIGDPLLNGSTSADDIRIHASGTDNGNI